MRALWFLFSFLTLPSVASDLASVKAKLGFQEGTYKLVSGSEDNCQASLLPLHYESGDDNVLLILGEHFTFAKLNHEKFSEDELKGCSLSVTNELAKFKILQKKVRHCEKSVGDYQSTQSLDGSEKRLHYSYQTKGKSKDQNSTLDCVFELQSKGTNP